MPYERKRVKCAVPDCPHYFKKRSEVAKYCYTCREKLQRKQSRVGMAKLRAERRAQTQNEKKGAVSQFPESYFEKGMVAQNASKPKASFKANEFCYPRYLPPSASAQANSKGKPLKAAACFSCCGTSRLGWPQ